MTTFTKSDVENLGAGDELNERVSIALEYFRFQLEVATIGGWPWPFPTPEDRLRRQLELPPPHPTIGNPSTYAGPAYSSWTANDLTSLIDRYGLSCGIDTDSPVVLCQWLVVEAMTELGMD